MRRSGGRGPPVGVTVPKTVRVLVKGDARGLLSPKDLILHIIGDPYFREEQWRSGPTDTAVIQFGGPGLGERGRRACATQAAAALRRR